MQVVERLIRRHVALEPAAIVIDIGCGDTFVAEQLAARHPTVVFFAIDTAFTDELIEKYRGHVNPRTVPLASLDAIPPLEKPASLIILMDVIEHIQDDLAFLTDLRRRPFVSHDTTFLITVPAYKTLFCSHDKFLGHHRRYSARSLTACLKASGFTVIDVGYFFSSLLPIRFLQVLKERLVPVKPGTASTGLVAWNGGPLLATILRGVLVLDAYASMMLRRVAIRLGGLSSYAICMRSGESDRPAGVQ